MTEIEKLYGNAGVEKDCVVMHECLDTHHKCRNCNKTFYPPFTAEKQLELIKWLVNRPLTLHIGKYKGKYYFGNSNYKSKENDFEEALATRINDLWKSLTTEEQQQIKEILQ